MSGSNASGGGACMCAGRVNSGGPPSGTSTAESQPCVGDDRFCVFPESVTRTSVTIAGAQRTHGAAQPQWTKHDPARPVSVRINSRRPNRRATWRRAGAKPPTLSHMVSNATVRRPPPGASASGRATEKWPLHDLTALPVADLAQLDADEAGDTATNCVIDLHQRPVHKGAAATRATGRAAVGARVEGSRRVRSPREPPRSTPSTSTAGPDRASASTGRRRNKSRKPDRRERPARRVGEREPALRSTRRQRRLALLPLQGVLDVLRSGRTRRSPQPRPSTVRSPSDSSTGTTNPEGEPEMNDCGPVTRSSEAYQVGVAAREHREGHGREPNRRFGVADRIETTARR